MAEGVVVGAGCAGDEEDEDEEERAYDAAGDEAFGFGGVDCHELSQEEDHWNFLESGL